MLTLYVNVIKLFGGNLHHYDHNFSQNLKEIVPLATKIRQKKSFMMLTPDRQ